MLILGLFLFQIVPVLLTAVLLTLFLFMIRFYAATVFDYFSGVFCIQPNSPGGFKRASTLSNREVNRLQPETENIW